MPVVNTKGAASSQGFGEFAKSGAAAYIEDVFSTYLYTGTSTAGQSQTINNGIDLSTKGGLTIIKSRAQVIPLSWFDTTRGVSKYLWSNQTQQTNTFAGYGLTAFNNNGFTVTDQDAANDYAVNVSAQNYVSWTFRKQPKFFDVVTYTGNGSNRTIAHNLGSVPGCIIVKNASVSGNWQVYHNGLTSAAYGIQLNLTSAQASNATLWNSTAPTASVFSLGTSSDVNQTGATYVAYIFAHNAGGFGLTGTDNVISCGSYTGDDAAGNSINLGYEPQWILIKRADSATGGAWMLQDNMRGFTAIGSSGDAQLNPNTSSAETAEIALFAPTATGFTTKSSGYNILSGTYIYIAIRRGPMKVPTLGTSVFTPALATSNGSNATFTTNFPVDLAMFRSRGFDGNSFNVKDRLRGNRPTLKTAVTNAENSGNSSFDLMTTWVERTSYANETNEILESFRRASGFFDVVCYTGTGSSTTQTHNLGVAPELIIVKKRDVASTTGWLVGVTTTGYANKLYLNLTNAKAADSTAWNSTAPTSSVFSIGTNTDCNASTATFVAYLFATCAGVSKVGTYTGNGTTQTINCGFAGGARFVLIKRTDSTGDWYVYDTARGMTTLTDPYLLLNSGAAESATLGSVTTVTTGFALDATILAAINTNAATYIFLAIA